MHRAGRGMVLPHRLRNGAASEEDNRRVEEGWTTDLERSQFGGSDQHNYQGVPGTMSMSTAGGSQLASASCGLGV